MFVVLLCHFRRTWINNHGKKKFVIKLEGNCNKMGILKIHTEICW